MIWFVAGVVAVVMTTAQQPVSIAVSVPESVKHSQTVLLRMNGVIMRRDAPALWSVFWDKEDEQHLVGYVSSPANSALREPKPANFTLPLPAAAVAEIHRRTEMRFTFVPMRKLPEGGVSITTVRLE